MPFDCEHRRVHGADACLTGCPAAEPTGGCRFVRVEHDAPGPPPDPAIIDVAVLDMHHGWPNLGHDAIVHAVQNAVCDLQPALAAAGLSFRVISYEVRRDHRVPEHRARGHAIYLGTGGPGHIDPRLNDGVSPGTQGIREDPGWEPRVFALFDAIRADPDAALLAVCHTFGVMCRWLGAARPVLRAPGKGGKSAGIVENILTPAAAAHPWFGRLARELPDRRRLRVLDSRLYDLVPVQPELPPGLVPIGFETLGVGGATGEALTMLEVARDRRSGLPRIFAVNHHPEIVNRPRQLTLLRKRMASGEVSAEWAEERMRALSQQIDEFGDRALHVTASYTLLGPLRYYLNRAARRRAEALGRRLDLHEDRLALAWRPPAALLQRNPGA